MLVKKKKVKKILIYPEQQFKVYMQCKLVILAASGKSMCPKNKSFNYNRRERSTSEICHFIKAFQHFSTGTGSEQDLRVSEE